ncbi:MAG: 3-dehydroquinate synthase [Christensenellales bacterium]|nr:3-dehydroquinate synthase [Christensenellales bacterium]
MRTVTVKLSDTYRVCIGRNLISSLGEMLKSVLPPCRAVVITDSNVDALYGDIVRHSLCQAGYPALKYVFAPGEHSKNLHTTGSILDFLAGHQITRGDIIIALGGGIPGDVAGFAAAIYTRGIRFVQVPTTLLSAVDASVGGKTAVNLRAGKNLVGAFHQPSLVLTDVDIMQSLPQPLLSEGAAEIIKYGVIADAELFHKMCVPDWTTGLESIIARCIAIKSEIIRKDEYDYGARRVLNFGHTFGHALEKLSDYTLTHGQAVAAGMVMAAAAARNPEVCRRIAKANRNCGLPVYFPFDPLLLAEKALSDKKRSGNALSLVLPERIGKCNIIETPIEEIPACFLRGQRLAEEYTCA